MTLTDDALGRREATRRLIAWSIAAVFTPASGVHAQRGAALRARTDAVVDGRVLSRAYTTDDGLSHARAVGIVPVEFPRLMRALADFPSYDRLMPHVSSVRVLARSHGHASLAMRSPMLFGEAGSRNVDAVIEGDADGAHVVRLCLVDGDRREPSVAYLVSRTPGGVRTIVATTVNFAQGTATGGRARHAQRGIAVSLVANLRRFFS